MTTLGKSQFLTPTINERAKRNSFFVRFQSSRGISVGPFQKKPLDADPCDSTVVNHARIENVVLTLDKKAKKSLRQAIFGQTDAKFVCGIKF